METLLVLSAAVEGVVDEAVLRKICREAEMQVGAVYGRSGKSHLRQRINGYNQAASHHWWVVLVDLNNEAVCAPQLKAVWVPHPSEKLIFRVAVRSVEPWLLADRESIAKFLAVPLQRVPIDPEDLPNPKQTIIELAKSSHKREIREDIVPRAAGGRSEGAAYASRMIEFVENYWRPDIAAHTSDSLRRCIKRLKEIQQRYKEA